MSAESPLFGPRRQQQQQQQQLQLESQPRDSYYHREDEYAMAKRAAVEATLIGRETVETAVRQGEQLQNAEQMAGETEYTLDKANRLLRGMTWTGWWANKFTSDVKPSDYQSSAAGSSKNASNNMFTPPRIYDHVPPIGVPAAQAVQNYSANLQVLESCETLEQKQVCQGICDDMYHSARKEVIKLQQKADPAGGGGGSDYHSVLKSFAVRLGNDLTLLRQRHSRVGDNGAITAGSTAETNNRSALFGANPGGTTAKTTAATAQVPNAKNEVALQQEEHLDFMSKHLDELGSLASSLNTSLGQQSETLESLDAKSDAMLFKSKMVTRRTDAVIQNKSWTKPKKEFLFEASIRHVASGRYLAVTPNHGLQLADKLNDTCIFGIWQRQTASKVIGMQSKYSRRWVGQNLLGSLVCSAYGFDRREEWDPDPQDRWSRTPLLCASAGWGNGAYLLLQKDKDQLTLGSGGLQDKKIADLWCIESYS